MNYSEIDHLFGKPISEMAAPLTLGKIKFQHFIAGVLIGGILVGAICAHQVRKIEIAYQDR